MAADSVGRSRDRTVGRSSEGETEQRFKMTSCAPYLPRCKRRPGHPSTQINNRRAGRSPWSLSYPPPPLMCGLKHPTVQSIACPPELSQTAAAMSSLPSGLLRRDVARARPVAISTGTRSTASATDRYATETSSDSKKEKESRLSLDLDGSSSSVRSAGDFLFLRVGACRADQALTRICGPPPFISGPPWRPNRSEPLLLRGRNRKPIGASSHEILGLGWSGGWVVASCSIATLGLSWRERPDSASLA